MIPGIAASLLSALFLGLYDLSTTHAVRANAVLPVLFFANVCSTLVWLALLALDRSVVGGLPMALHHAGVVYRTVAGGGARRDSLP